MNTIFDLSQEKQEILDQLFWLDDDEELVNMLESIDHKIERKLVYCTDLLAETRGIVAIKKTALDEAKKRLDKQLKQAERAEARLVEFIKNSMLRSGFKKINGNIINITLVKTSDIEFDHDFDYSVLPEECFKHELSLKERLFITKAKTYAKENNIDGVYEIIKTSIRES